MTRKYAAAVCAVGLAMLGTTGARADLPTAAGFGCGFTSTDDGGNGVLSPGEQFGEIHAGPIVVASLTDLIDNPASGTVTCSINVGSDSYAASPAAAASSSGVAGLGSPAVVYLPPTPLSYAAPANSNVYMCMALVTTDAAGHSQHLYYDYTPDPSDPTGQTPRGFTKSEDYARCGIAVACAVYRGPYCYWYWQSVIRPDQSTALKR